MQLFIDYLPILAFFGAYFYEDIYFATAVLMFVMPVVLGAQWLLTRELNKIYAASTALVIVLGGATLALHDPLFLFWKPTVLNWAIALVFLGSQFIGKKPIVQRMMESAAELTASQWRRLNQIWVAFFIIVGALNLYVAYSFSEATWVKFKLFGMLGLTLVFVIIQTIWLAMTMNRSKSDSQGSESS
jgi:intracellular septation protein